MGYLNIVPLRRLRIVAFGDFHIFFSPNYFTLASVAVIVAHFIPTLHLLIASAAYTVTRSSVRSLFWIDRSK